MQEHFEVSVHHRGNGIDHLLKNRQTQSGEDLNWNSVHETAPAQSPTERVFNKFGYGKPSIARSGVVEVRAQGAQGDALPPLSFGSRNEAAPLNVQPPRLSRESLSDNPNNFYAANRPDGKLDIGLVAPNANRYNGSEVARLPQQLEPAKIIQTSQELASNQKPEAFIIQTAGETVLPKKPEVAQTEGKVEAKPSQELNIDSLLGKFTNETDLKMSHSVLPDGTAKTVQTASDFTSRTLIKRPDNSTEERITDRYGRPVYAKEVGPDNKVTVTAMMYNDEGGKVSPFVSSKRVTDGKGITTEFVFDKLGKVAQQKELGKLA